MAITEVYANFDLGTGSDDGTTEANAYQTWTSMSAGVVVGERLNCKKTASRYAPGADVTWALSATDLLVSAFRGYDATITDGVKFQIDTSTFSFIVSGEGCQIENLDATGTDISNIIRMSGDGSFINNFIAVNTDTSTNQCQAIDLSDCSAYNGYAESNSTNSSISSGQGAVRLARGTIKNLEIVATRVGVYNSVGSRACSIVDCLIYEKGTGGIAGVFMAGALTIAGGVCCGMTIDGYTTGFHIDDMETVVGGVATIQIFDTIISNATTGIDNTDSATKNMTANLATVAFYNCTTDTDMGDNEVMNKISLSADPYTDASTDDYTLNNTAGGGADCRAAALFGGA